MNYDTSGTSYVGAATSRTIALTLSASATFLQAFIMTTNIGHTVSSVTWAGGADFFGTSVGPATVGSFKQYGCFLVSPATGTNNLVFTISASGEIYCGGISYTGTAITGQYDASALNTSSLTQNLTTTSDNCWTACSALADSGALAASTNSTTRGSILNTAWGIFDSNGPVTPAGSFTMTQTGNGSKGGVMVAIRNASTSSSVKTAEGLAIASVKTGEGLAIASIKNWVGLA